MQVLAGLFYLYSMSLLTQLCGAQPHAGESRCSGSFQIVAHPWIASEEVWGGGRRVWGGGGEGGREGGGEGGREGGREGGNIFYMSSGDHLYIYIILSFILYFIFTITQTLNLNHLNLNPAASILTNSLGAYTLNPKP